MIHGYNEFEELKQMGKRLSTKSELNDTDVLIMQRVIPSIALDEIDRPSVLMDHGAARKFSFGFKHHMEISDPVVEKVMRNDIDRIRSDLADILQKPDVVLSNSEFTKWQLKRYFDVDSFVVNSPIDTDAFYPTDDDGDYFFSAQRMAWHKRVEHQIEAFAEMPDERLIIAGGEEYEEEMAEMTEPHDNIEHIGYVGDDELRRLYSGANAVLSTGVQEDFGLVPREAMACGTPYIAGHEGGYIELQDMGDYGVTFNSAFPVEGLQYAVERFDEDDYDPQVLRQHVIDNYSLPVVEERLKDAIRLAIHRYRNKED